MSISNKNIAFFISSYDFGKITSQSYEMAILFAEKGNKVKVFLYEHWGYSKSSDLHPNITIIDLGLFKPRISRFIKIFDKILFKYYSIFSQLPFSLFKLFFNHLFFPNHNFFSRKNNVDYFDYIFCVEAKGMMLMDLLYNKKGSVLVYHSLEIYLTSNKSKNDVSFHIIKKYERNLHRNIDFTLIQDIVRADLLYKDNFIKKTKTIFYPVSILKKNIEEKNYWHKKFNLQSNTKVCLQLGYIHNNRKSFQLINEFENNPIENVVLVIHGILDDHTWLKDFNEKNYKNVYVSTDIVDINQVQILINSCDIGLVFYTNSNLNDFHTGFSSEKLARYLMSSKPIVCSNYPTFNMLLSEFECGIGVESFHYLKEAIQNIINKYEYYSSNSSLAYEKYYNAESNFERMTQCLMI